MEHIHSSAGWVTTTVKVATRAPEAVNSAATSIRPGRKLLVKERNIHIYPCKTILAPGQTRQERSAID
jgi:hypothetical protein